MTKKYRPTADEVGAYAYMGIVEELDDPDAEVQRGPEGEYVHYPDYEKLAVALKRVKDELSWIKYDALTKAEKNIWRIADKALQQGGER